MSDRDIRAKILEDIYNRKRAGIEIRTTPKQYAEFLRVAEEIANFNIQYLIDAGLVKGRSIGSLGTTKKFSFVYDLTSFGVEAVEGLAGRELAVNYSQININAPVTQSQIAAGSSVQQTQSLNINTILDLEGYLDKNFGREEVGALKNQLRALEVEMKAGTLKTGTLQQITETIANLGPAATTLLEILGKIVLHTPHS